MEHNEQKPPIGIIPRHIHESSRLIDILEVILRYVRADMRLREEWISELGDLMGSYQIRTRGGAKSDEQS